MREFIRVKTSWLTLNNSIITRCPSVRHQSYDEHYRLIRQLSIRTFGVNFFFFFFTIPSEDRSFSCSLALSPARFECNTFRFEVVGSREIACDGRILLVSGFIAGRGSTSLFFHYFYSCFTLLLSSTRGGGGGGEPRTREVTKEHEWDTFLEKLFRYVERIFNQLGRK